MASKTRWKDTTAWVCTRHLQTVHIPATVAECWYFECPSVRPPVAEKPGYVPPRKVISLQPAKRENTLCARCGKGLYRKPSAIKKSKTGLFFCGRTCQVEYSISARDRSLPNLKAV